MHASREPTPRCYIRRCQTRYSEPSLYLYGHIHRVKEREREREGEGEGRDICARLYTRVGIYVLSITPLAHTAMHWRRVCVACTATRDPHRNLQTYSKCPDGIRWCGQCCLSFYASPLLSLSIHRETRGERIIRALSEMDFIRAAQSRDDTRVYTQEGMF